MAPESLWSLSHTSGLERQSGRTKEKWWWVDKMLNKLKFYIYFLLVFLSFSYLSLSVTCFAGMRPSLSLADSEEGWREGPRGDLLCGRPEFQRLR